MECERLIKLIKSWYLAVQDESLAPARMVSFMQNHIINCDVCLTDLEVQHEVDKITEIILPPPKRTASKPKKKEETDPEDQSDDKTDENKDEDNQDSDYDEGIDNDF